MKTLLTLLLALTMLVGLSSRTAAANPIVSFQDGKLIVFESGSAYTNSDLFDGFKGVMPGDVLNETIIVENRTDECSSIKVYMRAIPHDPQTNPPSDSVIAAGESIAGMNDFLSKLSLTVYNGSQKIYDDSPDKAGSLNQNVYLGTLSKGESLTLDVELTVPIELGNEYMNRAGEVDWAFVVECHDEPGTTTTTTTTTTSTPTITTPTTTPFEPTKSIPTPSKPGFKPAPTKPTPPDKTIPRTGAGPTIGFFGFLALGAVTAIVQIVRRRRPDEESL